MPKKGKICAVAECPATSLIDKELSFHRFPVDEKLRREWILKTNRQDSFNASTSRVCSRHFTADDFERDLKAELLSMPPKRLLRVGAVPSQLLRGNLSSNPSRRSERYYEKKRKQEHRSLVEEVLQAIPSTSALISTGPEELRTGEEEIATPHSEVQDSLNDEVLRENAELRKEVEKLRLELKEAKTSEQEYRGLLGSVFSQNELDILSKKKKVVRWTNDEIGNAFTLRYLSKRAYVYLRQTRGFPFPGISTLKRWASRLDLKSGTLYDVMKMMKLAATDLPELEKLCVLSFDEVKVQETLEYDEREDFVIGPHRQMQVVMARALTGKWKQPIFVAFDTKMTEDILMMLIVELHASCCKVVSVVSDCGGGNIGLWDKLGITCETPFFEHPVTFEKITYMPDVPHLLKLIRNWFLDGGYTLKDGTNVTKEPVQELLKMVSTEVSVCPKLKDLHLTCQRSQRQSVSLAAQLMSHTVGTALLRYTPGDRKLATETGKFIILINKWFDLFNVRVVRRSAPSTSPFGFFLEEQINLLNDVHDVVKGMRCRGRGTLLTFQKGVLMTCKGLPLLLENLRGEGVKFILTSKLNQDLLENLFSQIRAKGGLYDHPSPLNALYRLRCILLGKNPGLINTNANVTPEDEADENFILSDVLRRADVVPEIAAPEFLQEGGEISQSSPSTSDASSSLASDTTKKIGVEEEASKDAVEYIAGWLAFKYKSKFPELSDKNQRLPSHHSHALPSWISQLSMDGLTVPLRIFASKVALMEKHFLRLSRGKDFLKKKGLVKRIASILAKKN